MLTHVNMLTDEHGGKGGASSLGEGNSVRTESRERKSRQAAALERMTRAQKAHQQLNSGAPKYELRTAQEAVQLATAFYRQMRETMTIRELETDFAVHIAYMTLDFSMLFTKRYTPGQEKQLYEFLSQGCYLMVGLVFGLSDPERDGKWLIGCKPFLNTPSVRLALEQRINTDDDLN